MTAAREIRVHLALPYYSGDQFSRSLRTARVALARHDVLVPDPEGYRPMMTDHVRHANGSCMMPVQSERMWEVLGASGAEDLVLSFNTLFGRPSRAVVDGLLYPDLPASLETLREMFPGHRLRLMLNICNPGHLMAALVQAGAAGDALTPRRAREMRPSWAELVDILRYHVPEVEITAWAIEDTPFLWPRVLRHAAGGGTTGMLPGSLDMAAAVMTKPGRQRLVDYVRKTPPKDEGHLVKVLETFLGKFHDPDKLDFEIDLPGWDQPLMAAYNDAYRGDTAEIAAMDDVTWIA